MKSVKIGNINIENPICLSPMAGFSSLPFRVICNEMGAAYSPTELVSSWPQWGQVTHISWLRK